MHPPADHKDINMRSQPPEGISEAEKALRLANFWQQFDSMIREVVIREMESQPDYFCDVSDGIKVAILRGMEEIDLEKMHAELKKAGLLLESSQEEEKT